MIDVTLTWYEMQVAAQVGVTRLIADIFKNGHPKQDFGAPDDNRWSRQIEGAAGEMAFAKAAGLYWDGSVNRWHSGDDVLGFQVRTRSKHSYDLLIRENDDRNKRYALVTGMAPTFKVWGWMSGDDAMQPKYLTRINNDRPAAYFVPKADLHPVTRSPEWAA